MEGRVEGRGREGWKGGGQSGREEDGRVEGRRRGGVKGKRLTSTCCSTSPDVTPTGLGWNWDGLGWPVATSVLD